MRHCRPPSTSGCICGTATCIGREYVYSSKVQKGCRQRRILHCNFVVKICEISICPTCKQHEITRQATYVQRNIVARSSNHCSSRKAISITYFESVCLQPWVSSVKCACAILSSVASPALQYSTTLSHKQHDFRKKKKVTEHKMCGLVFSTTFV